MNTKRILSLLVATWLASPAFVSAAPGYYQVTGPVLEVSDSMIVIQKGEEKWNILRDAGTKITGELKVGAKVTIDYKMTATSVEVKEKEKEKEKAAPKKK